MKKYLVFLLSLGMLLSLAACAAEPAETLPQTTQPQLQEVEITMDNWQEYFELREAQRISVSDYGEIFNREFGHGVFLKEEYVNRLAEFDVSFGMQADVVRYQVYGDLTTDNYVIRKDTLHNEGVQTLEAPVEDMRLNNKIGPGTDLDGAVAAYFTLSGEFGC